MTSNSAPHMMSSLKPWFFLRTHQSASFVFALLSNHDSNGERYRTLRLNQSVTQLVARRYQGYVTMC